MRIACCGYAEKNTGSVPSANFLILKELLERGNEIDLYAINYYIEKNFSCSKELFLYENFKFFPISIKFIENLWPIVPVYLKKHFYIFFLHVFYHVSFFKMKKTIISEHKIKKYDLLLNLGTMKNFKINDLSCVDWLQGVPQAEWQCIKKYKRFIISLCGTWFYIKLKAYYIYRTQIEKTAYKKGDIFICCSRWARDAAVAAGVNAMSAKILPYPIDLDFFKPEPTQEKLVTKSDKVVFLWLGRIVPRKRFDLLIEAFDMLLNERKDVYLKIIGYGGYIGEYNKFIKGLKFPDHIEYAEYIEREKIPKLMSSVNFVIQTSENENFGSSIAEALSCGLQVILGPTNGTKDYTDTASFIFEQYSAESVKSAMSRAIEMLKQDREKLSRDARQIAEKYFDVNKITDKIEEIFRDIKRRDENI